MGPGYSKSYKRKNLRFLIALSLLFCGISYTLYRQQQTTSKGRSASSTGPKIEKQSQLDEVSRLQQQQEHSLEEIPADNVTLEQKVTQDVPKEDPVEDPVREASIVSTKHADVGKITISFGGADEIFDRAIRSHELHNKIMGYPYFVLREKVLPGLYSKHAYIFSVLVQELAKPEAERLKWVMWLDRDTVLMNPLLRIEDFLPPPGFEEIHLIATNDRNGLNNGVFILKVNEWALKLFHNALSFRHYNPEVPLKYSEQSAMEEIIKTPWYNESTAMVPQHWFNSFNPPSKGKLLKNHARPGSLLMHFASNRDGLRPERMKAWMDVAEQQKSEWSVPINQTFYPAQFREYWRRRGDGENVARIVGDLETRPR